MYLNDWHSPGSVPKERSAFYYWYLFLGLVKGYGPGHPLYEDFGDVDVPFEEWWRCLGDEVLLIGRDAGVVQIESESEYTKAVRDGALVVRIDKGVTRQVLLEALKDVLVEEKVKKRPGRRKHAEEARGKYPPKYPFHQRPDVFVLAMSYRAWVMRNRNPQGKPSLYQAGCALIAPDLQGFCLGKRLADCVVRDNKDPDAAAKKNLMRIVVSRYVRYGQHLIDNAALGIFPKYTPTDPADAAQLLAEQKARFLDWWVVQPES